MECDNFLFVHSTMHNNFTHIRGVKLLFAVMPTLTVIMSSGRKFIFLLDLMVILM